jgi:hypothetical protein
VYRLLNTLSPVVDLLLPGVGVQYRITCVITRGQMELGRVSPDQETAARVSVSGQNNQDTAALGELANELRGYVEESARATGPKGITPLFLAAVLRGAIANTPRMALLSPTAARERELARSFAALEEREAGGSPAVRDLNASVGVGQIKPSVAAIVTGDTAWIEQSRDDRAAGRARSLSNFMGLRPNQQRTLLTLLTWPKSNIAIAAGLLAQLKNRIHRYPKSIAEWFRCIRARCRDRRHRVQYGRNHHAGVACRTHRVWHRGLRLHERSGDAEDFPQHLTSPLSFAAAIDLLLSTVGAGVRPAWCEVAADQSRRRQVTYSAIVINGRQATKFNFHN